MSCPQPDSHSPCPTNENRKRGFDKMDEQGSDIKINWACIKPKAFDVCPRLRKK